MQVLRSSVAFESLAEQWPLPVPTVGPSNACLEFQGIPRDPIPDSGLNLRWSHKACKLVS